MKSIQLPDDIYQRAAEMAEVDHVSVDRLVAALVNEGIGDFARVRERAERGSREKLKRVLSKVRDVPADVRDQL
jgi:predicted DNA-binding ribbon-helix-helix protein